MSLGNGLIRYILYSINFLFLINGITIIVVGLSIREFYENYELLIPKQYLYLPYLLVLVGAGLFMIAFLGWCGFMNENRFLTLIFTTFLLLIFFFEIAIAAGGHFLRITADSAVSKTMVLPGNVSSKIVPPDWDRLQEDFNCCGINGPNDWTILPDSCCTSTVTIAWEITRLRVQNCTSSYVYVHQHGCAYPMAEFMKENSCTIEIVGCILAMLQLVGIVITCYLTSEFRKGYNTF